MTKRNVPLQVKSLCFDARGIRLIKDVSFDLTAGSRLMVLGANGAGKSLLMRLCHGLLVPHSGTVQWGEGQEGKMIRQAMVFQRPVMLRRTALANIAYGLKCKGVARRSRRDIAFDFLSRVGLARLANHPARLLSFGEQQRLALARAWAMEPDVLFMDEPTASLDPSATHAIEEITRLIAEEGTTIMMSTHDLGQAKRLGSDVLFLHRGRVLEQAGVQDFFQQPKNDLAQAFVRGELLWWKKKKDLYPGGGIEQIPSDRI